MEIAYKSNKVQNFYRVVNCVRKVFKPHILLIGGKEGNIVSNNEKVLKGGLNIMRSTSTCKMEWTMTMEKSGQCVYKLQNRMWNHQMMQT